MARLAHNLIKVTELFAALRRLNVLYSMSGPFGTVFLIFSASAISESLNYRKNSRVLGD